jgi:hypothetical protein
MTDPNQATNDAAKKQFAEDKAARAKQDEQRERNMKGKPTPTQEENDLAVLGAHITEHEDDGSGPDPNQTKQIEPDKQPARGGYATRASSPVHESGRHRSSE